MRTLTFQTHRVLSFYVIVMFLMIAYGLLFPLRFHAFFEKPDWYMHAKFVHIISVTLVFANAVIGTIWETRSLWSQDTEIIRYTYSTVIWLDAVFTAPLVLLSVISGIFLGTTLGGVWTIGWLSTAFVIYLFCGVVWLIADIPTQYKIKKLFSEVGRNAPSLPQELLQVLWFRLGLNLFTLVPLIVIFILMIHKPNIPSVDSWFH